MRGCAFWRERGGEDAMQALICQSLVMLEHGGGGGDALCTRARSGNNGGAVGMQVPTRLAWTVSPALFFLHFVVPSRKYVPSLVPGESRWVSLLLVLHEATVVSQGLRKVTL